MDKSKRLNRDHAKRIQRPMVEDRVIAEHLTALLTPIITCSGLQKLEPRLAKTSVFGSD